MSEELKCINCSIGDFKHTLCKCNEGLCKEFKSIGNGEDFEKNVMERIHERKKGKWIDDGTELGCCCSECGVTLDDYFYGALYEVRLDKIPNFCPNCGSYNGGEQIEVN